MSKKIEQLRANRLELLNKAEALTNAATDETPLTDEQVTEAEGYISQADALKAEIDREAERASKAADLHAKITAAKTAPDNPITRKILNLGGLNSGMHIGQDSAKVFNLPKNLRPHKVQNFVAGEDGMDPTVKAFRFGCWAMSLLGQQIPAFRSIGAQAERYARDMGLLNAAHGEGASDTTGAHVFVPTEFGTDLILLREQYGLARRVLNVVPMSSDKKTEPRQLSALTSYFVSENSAGTESSMSFDNVTLVAKDLMTLARISRQLEMDSVISWADKLVREIAYSFASKEDDCAFNGDGTSTYGGMTGILTRLTSLTAGTAPGCILGAGNAWSELTLANFQSVVGALPVFADTPNARWICHKTFYYTVMVRLALAAGGATATETVNGRRVPVFLGYPVEFSQKYPSTEANSQVPVSFGDHSMAAMFGDRAQDEIAFSDQATIGGESMFERNQIGVRGTERFDVVVHDYGSDTAAGPIACLETASS